MRSRRSIAPDFASLKAPTIWQPIRYSSSRYEYLSAESDRRRWRDVPVELSRSRDLQPVVLAWVAGIAGRLQSDWDSPLSFSLTHSCLLLCMWWHECWVRAWQRGPVR